MLLNNYWLNLHRISILIQPSQVLSGKGKVSGGNSDRNIAYLKRAIFASIYRILRLLTFANSKFFKNFKFLNFSLKESWIKGYLANISVKIKGKKSRSQFILIFNIDVLQTDSKNLAELILCIFFRVFHEICILGIFSVYLFSRMPFKRKLCVCLILRNQPKSKKKIYTRKLVHSKQIYQNSNPMTSSKIKNNILKTILAPWYREWLKQWKYLKWRFLFSQ